MRFEFQTLKSRIARRIYLAFIASAVVPVLALSVLSVVQVTQSLTDQAQTRLRQATKHHGHSIYEHLLFCEDELKLAGVGTAGGAERLRRRFTAMGRQFPDGRYERIFGAPIPKIRLDKAEKSRLNAGQTVVAITGHASPVVTLIRRFMSGDDSQGLVMGTVNPDYLWGIDEGNILPPMSQFTVVTMSGIPLFRSAHWLIDGADHLSNEPGHHPVIEMDGADWLTARWNLFLRPQFGIDDWLLVVFQPKDQVLAPLAQFKYIFALVVLVSLLLVVSLSLFNLRRSLGPIDALKEGALRITGKDFRHRVTIDSRDEFEELANCFNDMSRQLGRQFQILGFQAIINQATLMGREFGAITETAITLARKEFGFDLVAVFRTRRHDDDEAMIYMGYGESTDAVTRHPWTVDGALLERYTPEVPWETIDGKEGLGPYLPAEGIQMITSATLFPIFIKDRLLGLLMVAGKPATPLTHDTLNLTRQAADQMAMAWTNVNMIMDLRRLTIGSMRALARAVDAKSSWTAGHSARVMRMAMEIGEHMGLSPDRMDQLQQAALLHDIGKIGISSAILDKPGRLTDEEFDAIRSHPVIGDKILSPIPVFADIVPMVRQHHERWDGKGYPDGLGGDEINWGARILAVADVFDAIASDRPYRKGMAMDRTMAIIESESGRQFDPKVVAAFVELQRNRSALAA